MFLPASPSHLAHPVLPPLPRSLVDTCLSAVHSSVFLLHWACALLLLSLSSFPTRTSIPKRPFWSSSWLIVMAAWLVVSCLILMSLILTCRPVGQSRRCCQHEPCSLWQWATTSSGPKTGSELRGICLLGFGSLEFPCFPHTGTDGQRTFEGKRKKIPSP